MMKRIIHLEEANRHRHPTTTTRRLINQSSPGRVARSPRSPLTSSVVIDRSPRSPITQITSRRTINDVTKDDDVEGLISMNKYL